MADQPVELTDYDPTWAERFAEQQIALTAILEPWLAGPIEHVGSTAVPGLRAKPVIDMLAPVRSLEDARAALPALQRDGWLFWPEDPNRHYRMWFLRPAPAARTHHLHIMRHDHPEAIAEIRFRDALRADALVRQEYAALKESLAERYRTDRDAYTDAKSDFVRGVMSRYGADTDRRSVSS